MTPVVEREDSTGHRDFKSRLFIHLSIRPCSEYHPSRIFCRRKPPKTVYPRDDECHCVFLGRDIEVNRPRKRALDLGVFVLAFYDAVVRPETKEKKITLSLKSLESKKTTTEGELSVQVSIAKWITTIFPFLDASAGGKLSASTEKERSKEEGREVELEPIDSPQRQLVQLALHYVVNLPTRIRIVSNPLDPTWFDPEFAEALPRALVFLDFPPSVFLPMAAELGTGKVALIHEAYLNAAWQKNPAPDNRELSPEKRDAAWREYWDRFVSNFDAQIALRTLEQQAEGNHSYEQPSPAAAQPVLKVAKEFQSFRLHMRVPLATSPEISSGSGSTSASPAGNLSASSR